MILEELVTIGKLYFQNRSWYRELTSYAYLFQNRCI